MTADVNLGWYVAANGNAITTPEQLADADNFLALDPLAYYDGKAIGNVANDIDNNNIWDTYVATGDLAMSWSFANRTGDLSISHFDTSVTPGGLSFTGALCARQARHAMAVLVPATISLVR